MPGIPVAATRSSGSATHGRAVVSVTSSFRSLRSDSSAARAVAIFALSSPTRCSPGKPPNMGVCKMKRLVHAPAAKGSLPRSSLSAADTFLAGFSRLSRPLARGLCLDRRHLDAESGAKLADPGPDQVLLLSGPRRFPRPATDPALHRRRRRRRRSLRPAPAAHGLAIRPDDDRLYPRGSRLDRLRPHRVHPRAVMCDRPRPGLWWTGVSVADADTRAEGSPAERHRAQLDPVQP